MWANLVPLIIGSAILPMQIIVTLVLVRSPSGLRSAAAFVSGMTVLRLIQGLLLALVILPAQAKTPDLESGAGPMVTSTLLVIGVILLATALRQMITGQDPDAPPPRWLAMTASMKPSTAFGFGMAILAIGAKWWIFTIGAVAAISDADLGTPTRALTYLLFVVLAELPVLVIVVGAAIAPDRSAPLLAAGSTWLEKHNHQIVVVACLVFGLWFVLKALNDLGVL
jgi:hypothetical protein